MPVLCSLARDIRKGSGKTWFVQWLASELGFPIYYIDLRASFLDDSVLRDALTPRKLRHNLPVFFHFDEFQSMIEIWADNSKSSQPPRLTIQGFQSVLEGISTPNNAFLGVLASLHCRCRCLKGYLLGFRSGKGALFRKWHPLKEKAFRSFREELRGAGPHLVLCTSSLQTLESDHIWGSGCS